MFGERGGVTAKGKPNRKHIIGGNERMLAMVSKDVILAPDNRKKA